VGGRLPRQDAGRRRRLLLPGLPEEPRNTSRTSLPQNGEAQVVWPKNTSVSAAAVAALAEAGSSPAMKKYYPAQAAAVPAEGASSAGSSSRNAIAKYGKAAPTRNHLLQRRLDPQRRLAWAGGGHVRRHRKRGLPDAALPWFPNPADPSTFRWGWWRMAEGWGNAIRDYAFAASSGRLPRAAQRPYLAACQAQIVAAGDDVVTWSQQRLRHALPARDQGRPGRRLVLLPGPGLRHGGRLPDQSQARLHGRPRQRHELRGRHQSGQRHLPHRPRPEAPAQDREPVRPEFPPRPAPLRHSAGPGHGGFEYLPSYGSELSELSYPTDSGTTGAPTLLRPLERRLQRDAGVHHGEPGAQLHGHRASSRRSPRARPARGPPRRRPSPCPPRSAR
jgi:hypothetical protein